MKYLVLFFVVLFTMFSCGGGSGEGKEDIPVSSISINMTSADVIEGKTVQLNATVSPSNASEKAISWSSSNTSVATVSNGLVSAESVGETTITASAGGRSATCIITVKPKPIDVTSVELNKNQLELFVGSSDKLVATVKPDNASDKTVTWSTSDVNTVTVDNEGKVSAIKEGTAVVTAKSGDKTATCNITVKKDPGYVDIGLSVKWATRNLGASAPSDYGDYYAWGEIETKTEYTWNNYKWGNIGTITKYCKNGEFGILDNKTILDPADDVARVKLGGKWRMPTETEMQELYMTRANTNYSWSWVSINGHKGLLIEYLINGKSIFLPAAGWMGSSHHNDNSCGIWSSSLFSKDKTSFSGCCFVCFESLYMTDDLLIVSGQSRSYGLPIRPVIE